MSQRTEYEILHGLQSGELEINYENIMMIINKYKDKYKEDNLYKELVKESSNPQFLSIYKVSDWVKSIFRNFIFYKSFDENFEYCIKNFGLYKK